MITSSRRPTYAEVDLVAVRENVARLHSLARSANARVRLGAVVKADAYGHGAERVSAAAALGGADVFFVATLDEAIALRTHLGQLPIVLLGEPDPSLLGETIRHRITPTIHTTKTLTSMIEEVEALSRRDRAQYEPTLQLEVETGLHRLGSEAGEVLIMAQAAQEAGIGVTGIYSHLARADEGEPGEESVLAQVVRLQEVYQGVVGVLEVPPLLHLANTAGLINYPQTGFDLIRLGIGMYGYGVSEVAVRPVLRLVSRVTRLHQLDEASGVSYGHRRWYPAGTSIATIPIGYADGFRRGLFEAGGQVLIRGTRHPLAGVVAMDHLMVAVTDSSVVVGDEVVLIGAQGSEFIGADELATRLSTISYEILTGISDRVPRRYRG
ncbi:alanine racemase [Ferrimicrobium sp.]|uniref:alanine racemase n=1 Tax=Ferrimicrobium sp. TaxID=2926050 RepID=UPI00260901A5|nr:alanine racemase [Ferrimicrobium sp.]